MTRQLLVICSLLLWGNCYGKCDVAIGGATLSVRDIPTKFEDKLDSYQYVTTSTTKKKSDNAAEISFGCDTGVLDTVLVASYIPRIALSTTSHVTVGATGIGSASFDLLREGEGSLGRLALSYPFFGYRGAMLYGTLSYVNLAVHVDAGVQSGAYKLTIERKGKYVGFVPSLTLRTMTLPQLEVDALFLPRGSYVFSTRVRASFW